MNCSLSMICTFQCIKKRNSNHDATHQIMACQFMARSAKSLNEKNQAGNSCLIFLVRIRLPASSDSLRARSPNGISVTRVKACAGCSLDGASSAAKCPLRGLRLCMGLRASRGRSCFLLPAYRSQLLILSIRSFGGGFFR